MLSNYPGVKDKSRVRKILQGTAKLEFWETYDNREIFGAFDQANTYLRELNKVGGSEDKEESVLDDAVSDESVSEEELASTDSTVVEEEAETDDLLADMSGDDSTMADGEEEGRAIFY